MSSLTITPALLCGTVNMVPSKSETHRAVICALLSRGKCRISPVDMSDDITATVKIAEKLGAVCTLCGDILDIDSSKAFLSDNLTLDCVESGSTLRFMLAVTAAMGVNCEFIGRGRLPQRPLDDFYNLFPFHGANMTQNHLPLTVSGKLESGKYTIRGDISSQFITGLLLSLPLLSGDSEIIISTALESKPYVDMTIECMAKFGVKVTETESGYLIKGDQKYKPCEYHIEGDWSQSAFFLAAGVIGGDVTLLNLNPNSVQGDKEIFNILKRFNADIYFDNDKLHCKASKLKATDIDASQIPDLVPAIAVVAAFAEGKTKIYGAKRLKYKESNRIKSVCDGLMALGCNVTELDDGMEIMGTSLHGGEIDCCNDHRIAMSMSVAASYVEGKSVINGYECINKSYPGFYEDFKSIGGVADVNNR
ncbi:MAG: 3-phosphoshikimate 1-carboxyvinyltransferase [Clostridia bacterium]|nr:3-phosphoshikimate 1-carboxyvinyltransferase [Clostridia bacterium]